MWGRWPCDQLGGGRGVGRQRSRRRPGSPGSRRILRCGQPGREPGGMGPVAHGASGCGTHVSAEHTGLVSFSSVSFGQRKFILEAKSSKSRCPEGHLAPSEGFRRESVS